MTPQDFIAKWRHVELKERSASQSHFNDLCALIGLPDPVAADPKGEWFTFEKGATKTAGGEGWADVWRRGAFAWEYKGRHANLDAALKQLLLYAAALENPPLLIVSDMDRIRIHTNWTNTVQQVHELTLEDLLDAARRDLLRHAFTDPDRLRPATTRATLTEEAAQRFAALAQRLRDRGHDAQVVAHFVNRLVFCLFAEDVGLLPDRMFQRLVALAQAAPSRFASLAGALFAAMRTGGDLGLEAVPWFNGGLFDDDAALPLDKDDLTDLLTVARLDWSAIDPSILGTLFERGLDPGKRAQLGAHYTSRDMIGRIIEPVVVAPLLAEWGEARAAIEAQAQSRDAARGAIDAVRAEGGSLLAKDPGEAKRTEPDRQRRIAALRTRATRAQGAAQAALDAFLERLRAFRVLDPACGSGNFLYLALRALKDLEHRANLEGEALGLARRPPRVGPENVLGIELNPFAAELARVSVWIGDIQWMRANGYEASRDPILRPLATIENRDALLNPDGTRAEWPAADAVVGNPPFLGGKRLRATLGDATVNRLFAAYRGEVRPEADLVLYWFAKAGDMIREGRLERAGFVATNSIRGGANRATLERAVGEGRIFDVWDDEPWVLDGAAVRVSMVSFDRGGDGPVRHDGEAVEAIHADLTARRSGAAAVDLTRAARLRENAGVAFQGPVKVGAFDVDGEQARDWLQEPQNPNGRYNSAVVRPLLNGSDIVRRPSGRWIVDFGTMSEAEASLFEKPFEHVVTHVKPVRQANKRERRARFWWQHGETVPGLKAAMNGLRRAIFTPRVSKHRLFVWSVPAVVPDSRVFCFARDDDVTFGVLSSRFHEIWSLATCSWHGVGNDPTYNATTCFETFPFPDGLTPDRPAMSYAGGPGATAIAQAAARLDALREAWLNPPDLVDRVPEVVPGVPDRLVPKTDAAAATLKTRTLTNLYNDRPAWLANAHAALDATVADAYGWGDDWRAGRLTDDEALARLFRLNQERARGTGPVTPV